MRTIEATIRRISDGVERVYVQEWEDPGGESWAWTEGNFGCDCNREVFFASAGDEDPPERAPGTGCGTSRFQLVHLVVDGRDELWGPEDRPDPEDPAR